MNVEMRSELMATILSAILLLMTIWIRDVNGQAGGGGKGMSVSSTTTPSSKSEAGTDSKGGSKGKKSGDKRVRRIAMKRTKGI